MMRSLSGSSRRGECAGEGGVAAGWWDVLWVQGKRDASQAAHTGAKRSRHLRGAGAMKGWRRTELAAAAAAVEAEVEGESAAATAASSARL